MRKIRYRATDINKISTEELENKLQGERVVVGVDVAKTDLFAAIVDGEANTACIVKWKQPEQNRELVQLVSRLGAKRRVEVALEPSGTYADALKAQLEQAGLSVFRVQPKRTHDAAEVYDGVPSLHDAKSATLVARLHLNGVSEPWKEDELEQRRAKAALSELRIYRKQYETNRNRLDSLLSRYFPELTELLLLKSVTLLELLGRYGGPGAIAEQEAEARELMREVGGPLLKEAKIEAVLEAARRSIGVKQLAEEVTLVKTVARETRRNQREFRLRERAIGKLTKKIPVAKHMSSAVGRVTASVLLAASGDPTRYATAKAYLKSFGLNLKEKSSGKHSSASPPRRSSSKQFGGQSKIFGSQGGRTRRGLLDRLSAHKKLIAVPWGASRLACCVAATPREVGLVGGGTRRSAHVTQNCGFQRGRCPG